MSKLAEQTSSTAFNPAAAANENAEVVFDLQKVVDEIHREHPEIYDRVFFFDCRGPRLLSPVSAAAQERLNSPELKNFLQAEANDCTSDLSGLHVRYEYFSYIFVNAHSTPDNVPAHLNRRGLVYGDGIFGSIDNIKNAHQHLVVYHELAHAIVPKGSLVNNRWLSENIADMYGILHTLRRYPDIKSEFMSYMTLSSMLDALHNDENPALCHYTAPAVSALSRWIQNVDIAQLTENDLQDISLTFATHHAKPQHILDILEEELFAPLRTALHSQDEYTLLETLENILTHNDHPDVFIEAKRIATALLHNEITIADPEAQHRFNEQTRKRFGDIIQTRRAIFDPDPVFFGKYRKPQSVPTPITSP